MTDKYPDVVRREGTYRLTLQAKHGSDREPFDVDVDFERHDYWYGYRVNGARGQEEFAKHAYVIVRKERDDG